MSNFPSSMTQWYCALSGIAFITQFTSVMIATVYYAVVNQLPTNISLINFIQRYSSILPLPTTFFIVGMFTYALTFIVTGFVLYGRDGCGPIVVCAVLVALFSFVVFVWVDMQRFSVLAVNQAIELKQQNIAETTTTGENEKNNGSNKETMSILMEKNSNNNNGSVQNY